MDTTQHSSSSTSPSRYGWTSPNARPSGELQHSRSASSHNHVGTPIELEEKEKVSPHTHRSSRRMSRLFRRPSAKVRRKQRREGAGAADLDESGIRRRRGGLWGRWLESPYTPALVVKNTQSVARDHLASERTYLAYVRTSLGMTIVGVALVQLFAMAEFLKPAFDVGATAKTYKLQQLSRPLGSATVALSFVVIMQAVYRYFRIQFALFDNNFPIARISTVVSSVVFSAIVVTIFAAILAGK